MTDCTKLRAAINGLAGLAAEEEAILLDQGCVPARPGTPTSQHSGSAAS